MKMISVYNMPHGAHYIIISLKPRLAQGLVMKGLHWTIILWLWIKEHNQAKRNSLSFIISSFPLIWDFLYLSDLLVYFAFSPNTHLNFLNTSFALSHTSLLPLKFWHCGRISAKKYRMHLITIIMKNAIRLLKNI